MPTSHNQIETVRAYLLGTLSGDEALALEERYLADRAFFLWIKEIESGLIRDYLDGRCAPVEIPLFEERYLRVADLRARLEEVRRQHVGRTNQQTRLLRPFALVTSFALVAISVIALVVYVQTPSSHRSQVVTGSGPTPLKIMLTAGVTQSTGALMPTFSLPTRPVPVELTLELPIRTNESLQADLSEIGVDGRFSTVAAVTGLVPTSANSIDLITFRMESAQLHHGDFVISVRRTEGDIIASYLFRLRPSATN
jgi:hypothetical protein